jgi:hypothetical protein
MKTAYELAMERLNKAAPSVKFTDEQKKQLADLDSQCAAKIAERELFLQGEITKAVDRGDNEALAQLEKQLVSDRKSIRADFEEKKERVSRYRGAHAAKARNNRARQRLVNGGSYRWRSILGFPQPALIA